MKKLTHKNQSGFAILEVLLIIVLVAAVTGIGYYVYNQRKTTHSSTESSQTGTQAEMLPSNLTGLIQFSEAQKIAADANPTDTVIRVTLETEEGKPVYVITFKSGKKVLVDAKSGTIVTKKQAEAEKNKQELTSNSTADVISVSEAKAIIAKIAGDRSIKQIELEDEDGTLIYSAELSDGSKVVINAVSGAVISKPAEKKSSSKESSNETSSSSKTEDSKSSSNDSNDSNSGDGGSGGGSGDSSGHN